MTTLTASSMSDDAKKAIQAAFSGHYVVPRLFSEKLRPDGGKGTTSPDFRLPASWSLEGARPTNLKPRRLHDLEAEKSKNISAVTGGLLGVCDPDPRSPAVSADSLLELAVLEAAGWLRGSAAKQHAAEVLRPLLAGVHVEEVWVRRQPLQEGDGSWCRNENEELSACLTVFGEELEWEADLTVVEGEPTGLVQLDPFVSGFLGRLSGWTLSTLTADDDWEESGTSLRELAERWRQQAGLTRDMIGWLDVHRAVAACIGTYISMSANNNSEWIVAAIMEVVEARMKHPLEEHLQASASPARTQVISLPSDCCSPVQRKQRWTQRRKEHPHLVR